MARLDDKSAAGPGEQIAPERTSTTDPISVALQQLAAAKKERSFWDMAGAALQSVTAAATLFLLIYGFAKFGRLDELIKASEATSKAVTAKYDKTFRIDVDGDLSADVDKSTLKSPTSLFAVNWHVRVSNSSKQTAIVTLSKCSCSIGKSATPFSKDLFEHFGPPEIVKDSDVSWKERFVKVVALDLKDDRIRQAFSSTGYQTFLRDQKAMKAEITAEDDFLVAVFQPGATADETESFLVGASSSDHLSCLSRFRVCWDGEDGKGQCGNSETADSTHLWLAKSQQKSRGLRILRL